MQYRDKSTNLRDIGKALGVSNILEVIFSGPEIGEGKKGSKQYL